MSFLPMCLIYLQMWVQEALSYFKGENNVPKRK